jgi:hypothetical protein
MTRRIPSLEWIKLVLADKDTSDQPKAPAHFSAAEMAMIDKPVEDDPIPAPPDHQTTGGSVIAWPLAAPYATPVLSPAPQNSSKS